MTVYFCGDYNLSIGALFNPARLYAVGSADAPITFQPVEEVINWGHLYFGDSLEQGSILQYATLIQGGGASPEATSAALYISDRHNLVDLASPVIDQVTAAQSSANGIYVGIDNENDPTSPSFWRPPLPVA